jgi:hypothetical protein
MARLTYEEVQRLVANNRSPVLYPFASDHLLICLIWKESSFDPSAKNPGSSATGLMMMTKDAVTDANHHAPHGTRRFNHSEMTNPALNIECGTLYLRVLIDRHHGLSKALEHFGTGAAYAQQLLKCETCIKDAVQDTIEPGVPRNERKPASIKPCLDAIHH